jgi:hypothetical protein
VRIALARVLGGDIDGAWWPHSGSVASELPELIEALHGTLGEILDIKINWAATESAPDLNSMGYDAKAMPGWRQRRQRLMVIDGRLARAKLLVVPHMTMPALGLMVLHRASGMAVSDARQATKVFETADRVVRAALEESALWAQPVADAEIQPTVGLETTS